MQTQASKTEEKSLECYACLGSGSQPKPNVVTERIPCPECLRSGYLAQYLTRTEAMNLIDQVRQLLVNPIHGSTVEESIRQMMAHDFCVPPLRKCTGEAHGNAFIDNCGACMPRWGITGKKIGVK